MKCMHPRLARSAGVQAGGGRGRQGACISGSPHVLQQRATQAASCAQLTMSANMASEPVMHRTTPPNEIQAVLAPPLKKVTM